MTTKNIEFDKDSFEVGYGKSILCMEVANKIMEELEKENSA